MHQYIHAENKDGFTAFKLACDNGHKDVVKLILDHPRCQNIRINAKDQQGNTALMLANSRGHNDVVKLLQDHLIKSKNFKSIQNEAERPRLH